MRLVLCLLLLMTGTVAANAQPKGQQFVAVSFHDIVDRGEEVQEDAVTGSVLAQFFDWMKATGWTAISLDDLEAARRGARPLPDKAILISFDDGYRSLYTRVFPLLKVYRYPAVAAVVGKWLEGGSDSKVRYGDELVPRTRFVSWAEAREMQSSGLVEFASHSYDLHRTVQMNPQGNVVGAAKVWRYDDTTDRYESEAEYGARIRADLQRARVQMATQLGRVPRALVWPYGRFTGPGLEIAKSLGFTFVFTLEQSPASTADLYSIHRLYPHAGVNIGTLVSGLRFEPSRPGIRRIACVTLDELAAAAPGAAQDEVLGRMIEGLRALGANTVVIDAHAALPSPSAPLGDVFFPTEVRPLRADVLARASRQIGTRVEVDTFLRLPLGAAFDAVGEAGVLQLFADMKRMTVSDGVAIDLQLPPGSTVAPEIRTDIRARRAALDLARFDARTRLGLKAVRVAAAIDPRQFLMVFMGTPMGPPDWVDVGVLPPTEDVAQTVSLAARLRSEGWFRSDASSRVALSLPPTRQIEAIRIGQRQGATAFALCPQMPALPPSPALSAAFSAATYPYRP